MKQNSGTHEEFIENTSAHDCGAAHEVGQPDQHASALTLVERLRARSNDAPRQAPTTAPTDAEIDLFAEGASDESCANPDPRVAAAFLRKYNRFATALLALTRTGGWVSIRATQTLLSHTTRGTRVLGEFPARRFGPIVHESTVLPLLGSRRKSLEKAAQKRMKEVALGEGLGPGWHANARWPHDAFANVALEFLIEVTEGRQPHAPDLVEWKYWREILVCCLNDYLEDHPEAEQMLQEDIRAERDWRTPNALHNRIVERVLNRARAILGVKKDR